ncbi:MAG: hypothetical protein U5M51_01130 [Emticicia sp.]|nr:hypothetical protein [Emticicia sp.]
MKVFWQKSVKHYDLHKKQEVMSGFLSEKAQTTIMLTCGASCPDAVMEAVLLKILSFFNTTKEIDELLLAL